MTLEVRWQKSFKERTWHEMSCLVRSATWKLEEEEASVVTVGGRVFMYRAWPLKGDCSLHHIEVGGDL